VRKEPIDRILAGHIDFRLPTTVGTACGLMSAVGYTAANICLRWVSHCDPFWVSAVKAFPTVVLVGPWLLVRAAQAQTIAPSPGSLGRIVVAALLGQLFGNVLFQWSLGVVGMAMTVPLNLGSLILCGALVGHWLLDEPVTRRTAFAVVILIVAIAVLAAGAPSAVVGDNSRSSAVSEWYWQVLAVAASCGSGVAYCILGVALRHSAREGTPLSTILTTVCFVGVLSLGGVSLRRMGMDGLRSTSQVDMGMMLLAGVFNCVAFLSLTKALQLAGLLHVNALNASQTAMAALAGVAVFREPLTLPLATGVALTVYGLLAMKKPRPETD
jgi:drug/metabolite transporter (DMT)-like permease